MDTDHAETAFHGPEDPVPGWFSLCGFAVGADHLVFEAHFQGVRARVAEFLDPAEIADDPGLVYCYALSRVEAGALLGREDLPPADYFVNACQAPVARGP